MKISISGLLVMIFKCINLLDAQKYWSCDSNCPLRCNNMENSAENPVCCFIPDVTILSITFSSECHFNCANKCYSGGLRIHNKGICEGKYSSSESDSRELTIEESTTLESLFEEPDDAFDIGSATPADILVTNETSIKDEHLEALEKAAVTNENELDRVSSRRVLKRKKKIHSKTTNNPTAENINDLENLERVKEIENNDIGDDTPSTPIPDIIEEITKDEMEKNAESNGQKRIGKKMGRITTPPTVNTVIVNDIIENTTSILDLVTTSSPIEVSTKIKKRKKKGKKLKINDTISLNTTEENTLVTTGNSIVDLVNSLPIATTVSTIEASTISTNVETKKHKRKKGSKLKQNATTAPPNTDQYNGTTTETNIEQISPANVSELSVPNIHEILPLNTTGPESTTAFPSITSVGTIPTTTTLPSAVPTTFAKTIPETVPIPESLPEIIPSTLPTLISTTLSTTIPTTLSTTTTIPTTLSTTIPTALSTTIPTALSTTIPTTIPTTLPTTIPTTLSTTIATTIPTTLPTTLSTTIPTTLPTTIPTTLPTTISTTVHTKKKSKKKSKKSKKVVEEVDEFDKPSNDDDAWAKDLDLMAYSR